MYSYRVTGSRIPSSRWDWHRRIHLPANSEFSGSRGMKFRAKAVVRMAVLVPTMNWAGTWTSPRSIPPADFSTGTKSSSTDR